MQYTCTSCRVVHMYEQMVCLWCIWYELLMGAHGLQLHGHWSTLSEQLSNCCLKVVHMYTYMCIHLYM